MNHIEAHIQNLRKRVRLLLIERYVLIGATAGTCVSIIIAILSGWFPMLLDYRLWALMVIVGALAGGVLAWLRKFDDISIAISADRRSGMKERLSTALSLGAPTSSSASVELTGRLSTPISVSDNVEAAGIEKALIADAEARYSSVKPSEVFVHRFGKYHIAFAASMLILLGVIFLPTIPSLHLRANRHDILTMKQQGKKLVHVAKDMKKSNKLGDKDMKRLASRMQKLGFQMQTGRLQRKQAMLATEKLTRDIAKKQEQLARQNSNGKTMEQARQDLRRQNDELTKQEAAKIASKENIPLSEAMKRVPQDKRLTELARKNGPLTKSEKAELERLAQKYANPNNNLSIPPELSEALAKLAANGDYQKAAELMRQLAQNMNMGNTSKMSKADQAQLQKQMEQLAKALKNTDLDQLAKQMLANAQKLSQMSPAELKKMIAQMKQAQMAQSALAEAGGT